MEALLSLTNNYLKIMTLNLLVAYIKKMIEKKRNLEIRINLHKGDISARAHIIDDMENSQYLKQRGVNE